VAKAFFWNSLGSFQTVSKCTVESSRYVLLFTMLVFQACSSSVEATPTLEQLAPAPPKLAQSTSIALTPTVEILEPTPTFEPPAGFKQYQDTVVGVSVYVPESWVVIEVDPGQLAYLLSYPEDKYIGGEAFQSGDTKCDLYFRHPDANIGELIQEWKSGPFTTVISENEIVLQDGKIGTKIEIESMGHSVSVFTEVNERVVVLSCFGELGLFDQITATLGESK